MKIRSVLISLLALVGLASAAFGQTINNLGNASTLGGSEYFPVFQTANPAKKTTTSAIATYVFGLMSGDCTVTSLGFVTCSKTGGVAFGTFATQNYATPPAIGGTTPNSGAFTTLSANSTVSGAGFTSLFASPPAIGSVAAGAGTFTSLTAAAISGSPVFLGIPSFTGLSPGTQVSCLGLDATNKLVYSGAACGSGGGGGTPGNPTATASDVAVNGVATTYMRSDAAPAVQKGTSGQFGLMKCDGVTITCASSVLATGGTVVAGTTQTVTATQWNAGTTFRVTTAAQTLTLPASSTLSVNGGLVIQTIGQSVTLAPNAADAINGGTVGASVTIASGLSAYVTTDGAGNISASPITTSATAANPTATASDVAVNGTATTFMRSDAAPAVQKGSSSVFGVVKVDGTTITATGGVITATAGGSGCTITGSQFQIVAVNAGGTGCTADANATVNAGALALGASGTAGSVAMGNATSGVLTLAPVTGALGTVTASFPANTGTVAELNLAQTWTATQTFAGVNGSSDTQSGTTYTLVASDCGKTVVFTSATAVTVTIPASIVPAAGTVCAIAILQAGAGQVSVNGSAVSAATLVSAHAYTKTFGQNAMIGLTLTTISAVATAVLTGDGA